MNYLKSCKNLTIAAFLSTSAIAFAMPPGGPECGPGSGGANGRYEQMSEQMKKRHVEHQNRLHDALKLKPEQEAAWKQFVTATQPSPKADVKADPKTPQPTDTPSRMERMLELHLAHGKQMEDHVQAVKTFYNTLSPEQKKTFDEFHTSQRETRRSR